MKPSLKEACITINKRGQYISKIVILHSKVDYCSNFYVREYRKEKRYTECHLRTPIVNLEWYTRSNLNAIEVQKELSTLFQEYLNYEGKPRTLEDEEEYENMKPTIGRNK